MKGRAVMEQEDLKRLRQRLTEKMYAWEILSIPVIAFQLSKEDMGVLRDWEKEFDERFSYSRTNGLSEDIKNFIRKALSQAKEEARREVVEEIQSLRGKQIIAFGSEKLPFVFWGGKADEKETIIIYEQAFKDILQALTPTTTN